MHLARSQQRKGHLLLLAVSADPLVRLQVAAGLVELSEQRTPQIQPRRVLRRQARAGQLQLVGRPDAEERILECLASADLRGQRRPFRGEFGVDRVVAHAEHRAVGSGQRRILVLRSHHERQRDIARQRRHLSIASPISEVIHERTDERPLPLVPRLGLDLGIDLGNAGRGVDGAVQRIGMRQRADHRQAIHDPSDLGQSLADVDSRHAGRNRLQLPLNLGRRLRLGIERLVLRRRAVLVDQDARLGLAELGRSNGR